MKICKECKILKELEEFSKNSQTKDGLKAECKSCTKYHYQVFRKDKIKKYNEGKKRERKEYNKKYYNENKNAILVNKKNYRINNLEKTKESINKKSRKKYLRDYTKKKRQNDPLYKLIVNIRSLIFNSFKNKTKKSKTIQILGCSFLEFKLHIESKFTEGMTWENHGQGKNGEPRWQLDHIKPISMASSESEIYELNHYSNFQPLWEFDNKSKGNRFIG